MTDIASEIPGRAIPEPAVEGRSTIDRIRERQKGRLGYKDLRIPRWDGDVIVRYGRLTPKALKAAARRKGLKSNAELLAAACREILVVNDAGETESASASDGQPGPVRFDSRLAAMFELRGNTSPAIVIAMYADEIAIGAHAKRIYDWQTGADLDDEDLDDEEVEDDAGEEDAAT